MRLVFLPLSFALLAETDDESMDTSDEVSTTPAKSTKSSSNADNAVDGLSAPALGTASNLVSLTQQDPGFPQVLESWKSPGI